MSFGGQENVFNQLHGQGGSPFFDTATGKVDSHRSPDTGEIDPIMTIKITVFDREYGAFELGGNVIELDYLTISLIAVT